MDVRQTIIDSLHWKEYTFVGQGNSVYEGRLTQESEEAIADHILAIIQETYRQVDEDAELPANEAWQGVEREFEAYCAGQNDMLRDNWRKVL